jgi:hypothetical protein
MKKEELKLTQDWDKTFPKSDKVDHCKVTFVNRYGITLAADMYVPKDAEGKLPAIAVCGPGGINSPAEASGRNEEQHEAYEFGEKLQKRCGAAFVPPRNNQHSNGIGYPDSRSGGKKLEGRITPLN